MSELETVPGPGNDIEPGAYKVKLIKVEPGPEGEFGKTMFWNYEIYDSGNNVIKEIRRITSLKTGKGSRVKEDTLALGLDLREGMKSEEIISTVVGKYAVANVITNKNGYAGIESLSPAAAQVVETNAAPLPSNDEELPF
jgi:hypothetical protein|tara:strand:- start:143 stop:562 length:420 start_codon:yes stop_codon:yes gene_type:complete